MSFLAKIADLLRDPRLKGVDIDSTDLMTIHREVLQNKPMMRGVFEEFYQECISNSKTSFLKEGEEIELGAGVSLFKQNHPHIISTDIKPSPYLDQVLDAQDMDLPDNSVRAFYGLNCFHHLPEPRKFFSEINRVCKKGGSVVLIEPYHSFLGRILYKYMHRQEYFDMDQKHWEAERKPGQFMSNANQALSYIVFVRDQEILLKEFPELKIDRVYPLNNWIRYLISGGLNFRALLPDMFIPLLKIVEKLFQPLSKIFALHYVIVIRRV